MYNKIDKKPEDDLLGLGGDMPGSMGGMSGMGRIGDSGGSLY